MNETDSADKDVEDHGATSTLDVLKARAMLEEYIEGESATVEQRYQPPRVSWMQRVLSWFRRN
jgi:hypothetical protein